MPENQMHEDGQPIRVVDKREEKRVEAEMKRVQAEVEAHTAKLKLLDDAQADIVETTDGAIMACRFCTPTSLKVHGPAPHETSARVAIVAPETGPPPVMREGDLTARQQRIEELKTVGRDSQLTAEQGAEMLRLQAAEDEDAVEDDSVLALTAFIVVIGHDGSVKASHDVNQALSLDRLATIDDMDAGCAIVRRDIQASMTAGQVVFGLQVSAQAMGEKKASMDAMNRLAQQQRPGRRR